MLAVLSLTDIPQAHGCVPVVAFHPEVFRVIESTGNALASKDIDYVQGTARVVLWREDGSRIGAKR